MSDSKTSLHLESRPGQDQKGKTKPEKRGNIGITSAGSRTRGRTIWKRWNVRRRLVGSTEKYDTAKEKDDHSLRKSGLQF